MEPSAGENGERRDRDRQQTVVADLGQRALETDDLDELRHDASVAVSETLDTAYCAVLEPVADGDEAVLRNGVGWRDELVGTATVLAGQNSQVGYTLGSQTPVVINDLRTEDRFARSDILTDHDIVSGICVSIGTSEEPRGVLGTYTTAQCEFTADDEAFVQNVANVLAAAIDRTETERQLRERERHLERYREYTDTVLAAVDDVFYVFDEAGTFQRWNESLSTVTGYSDAEIESMNPLEFIADADRDAVGNTIAEVFDTGNGRVKADVVTRDGDRIPYEFVASRLEAPDGTSMLAGIGRDVTNLTERNRKLAKYERIVETINDGIYAADEDGYYTMVNDAFAELTGYTREELHGAHATRIVDEITLDEAADVRAEMIDDGGTSPTMETTVRTADGDRIPVEVTFATLSTDGHQERVGVVRDISARVERERALEASERRYRTLIENFPNGAVGLFDEDLCYTAVGGGLLDTLDLSPAERVGRSIAEIHSDDLLEEIEPYFHAALEGETTSFESNYHDRHLFAHTLPVRNAEDEVYAGMLVVQDVTERREAQRELRKSEAKFRMIAENVDEIVWMATADAEEIIYLNPAFEAVWGLDRNELYDDPLAFLEAVHPDNRDRVREAFAELPERAFDEEFRIVRPDGEVRWVHASGASVTDEGGEMDRIVGIGKDITGRKERERQLEELIERLEESNERLEQFAYAASHDLQEPLRMVSSYLQLIERRYDDALDAEGKEFLTFAVDGADRMRDMIEGLLEYSRVETQGRELEPVDLEEVLADVRENLQVKIEDRDAEITGASLPRVEGDERQLHQVLQNLLANAIEYSGEDPPQVHVTAERTRTDWLVSVTDEGMGIDPDDQDRIFEIFEGGHGETGYSGTGIGLALCERIVERHGGDIWVESEPAGEQRFRLRCQRYGTTPVIDGVLGVHTRIQQKRRRTEDRSFGTNVHRPMNVYEVREATNDYQGIVRTERGRPTPDADEALVRIRAASLNYRDLAIANENLAYPGAALPVVPLSDGAGDVVAVGDNVDRLSEGDRVATPFAPDWIDGPGTRAKMARMTGGNVDGALAEYTTFPAESLARLPDYLSYEQGATLSCAGLTAWRALVEDGTLRAGQRVLALGTGGVSTFALQFATMHGADVFVTSSSDDKLERARELGATWTLNYEETPDWGEVVFDRTGGVDHVVEVGGAGTLERSLEAAAVDGHIHLIGVLSGQDGQVHPGPILGKALTVEGVMGVGSRAMFDRMTRAMAASEMEPVIDRTFDFDEVREAYRYLEAGSHQGKVVITLE